MMQVLLEILLGNLTVLKRFEEANRESKISLLQLSLR
jgi:hypothetical protein